MKLTSSQRDRALGAVIGSAAGDALGAPFEFGGPYGTATKITMCGNRTWEPGEWTDDTSMAIPIAQALAEGKDLSSINTQNQIVAAWINWASNAKDVGIQISTVLSHAREELRGDPDAVPAQVCRRQARKLHYDRGRSAGNGSLMRMAPLPLAFLKPSDGTRLTEAARTMSDLTHFESDAGDACVLWTHAIAHAIRTGELDARAGVPHLPAPRRQLWLERLDEAESREPRDFERNGWVVQALQGAWSAIHHTRDGNGLEDAPGHFERALLAAVRGGRDADTVAAIAGALVGAAHGLSAIPLRWRRVLHGWPHVNANASGEPRLTREGDLVILAEKILNPAFVSAPTLAGFEGRPVIVQHPHDPGVLLGNLEGLDALPPEVTAVVSLSRVGTSQVPARIAPDLQVQVRLIDDGRTDKNPNLHLVLADATDTIARLRAQGHHVYVHCVQAWSRTPSVAALFSILYCDMNPDRAWNAVRAALPDAQPKHFLYAAVREVARARGYDTESQELTYYEWEDRLLYRMSKDEITQERWDENLNAWVEVAPHLAKVIYYDPDPSFDELSEQDARRKFPDAFKAGLREMLTAEGGRSYRLKRAANPLTSEDMAAILVLAIQNRPVSEFLKRKSGHAVEVHARKFWAAMRAEQEALKPGQYLAVPNEW